ncbi:MAG: GGDEF domain-containing protein [Deltaproteobacteria bacterium]|nr:GGDEF domain-containing protein [Deltaproteobacteria bacterium]
MTPVSETLLKEILDASPIGFSVSRYDDGEIIFVNSSLVKMFGGPAEKLIGSNSRNYFVDQENLQWVISHLRQNHSLINYEMELKRNDGHTIFCQVNIVVKWIKGEFLVLSWFNDISKERCNRALLEHMAAHDPLTGLPNRRRFREFMNETLARSRRLNRFGSLLYLDLDGFKAVNDNLGHDFGDSLLHQAARRIAANLRETDFVARLGGDEFAVVLEPLSDHTSPMMVAEKIFNSIQIPYRKQGRSAMVGVSIGIADFGPEAVDIDVIIRQADSAMYRAKQAGKNQICVYNPELDGVFDKPLHSIVETGADRKQ